MLVGTCGVATGLWACSHDQAVFLAMLIEGNTSPKPWAVGPPPRSIATATMTRRSCRVLGVFPFVPLPGVPVIARFVAPTGRSFSPPIRYTCTMPLVGVQLLVTVSSDRHVQLLPDDVPAHVAPWLARVLRVFLHVPVDVSSSDAFANILEATKVGVGVGVRVGYLRKAELAAMFLPQPRKARTVLVVPAALVVCRASAHELVQSPVTLCDRDSIVGCSWMQRSGAGRHCRRRVRC